MNLSTLPLPLLALALGMAGAVFGLFYFALLRRTVVVMAAGRGLPIAALLTLARIAGITAFLILAAKLGAAALLSAFIGFLLARAITMHTARSAG